MKKIYTLLVGCLFISNLNAQNLPHWLTQDEHQMIPSYLQHITLLSSTQAPAFKPRTLAEWEEISGLLITWTEFPTILEQVVQYAQPECTVYIVCSDSNKVKSDLSGAGVAVYNVKFLEAPFNSIWCRDYGQWNIYKNDVDSLSFTDWIYNRPRPKDDVIPEALATFTNTPIYETTQSPNDLVNTGGDFMVDGLGTAFSSKLILSDNGKNNPWGVSVKNTAQIDTILKHFNGINRYVLMDTLPYDVIHHIDMHMKLLNEETILVGQFPTGVSDEPQIDKNIKNIQKNYLDCYGRPYKIVRIPMVPGANGKYPPNADYRTYTNSVFVNKTMIIPLYNQQYDTTAIRIYKESLPGYKVVGIDCDNSGTDIISELGAIHCITKEIGESDPVFIDHSPLQSTSNSASPYLVEAKIETPSGVSNATVNWTTDTLKGFAPVAMTPEPRDSFYAYIPAQKKNKTIFYYITAESNSGRTVSKPLTAPEGWWSFQIKKGGSGSREELPQVILYDAFPNPASSIANIGFELPESMNCKLFVTDMLGRMVFSLDNESLSAGPHKVSIDVQSLPSGLYHLNLVAGKEVLQKMISVVH